MPDVDLDIDISSILRGARKREHLTQEELAYRAGISMNYLRSLESGSCSPDVGSLFNLAFVLADSDLVLIALKVIYNPNEKGDTNVAVARGMVYTMIRKNNTPEYMNALMILSMTLAGLNAESRDRLVAYANMLNRQPECRLPDKDN